MTTADERFRALKMINDFLFPAVFGSRGPHDIPKIKRVPREMRELVRKIGRHCPSNVEIDVIIGKLGSASSRP